MWLDLKSQQDRSPWGNFWFEPVGTQSMAGIRVTPDAAMRVTAVYGCVKTLAESFAILPPVLFEKQGRKTKLITNHWLYKLLAKNPNRYQDAYHWREMLQGHLALRGNAYNIITANGRGEITELMPLHPDRVQMDIQDDGSWRYIIKNRDGSTRICHREEIFHLKGLSPDIYRGYNPIELARDAVGTALAAQGYGARFFANDARPGGWIKFPGKFKDIEAKQIFRDTWQKMQGGANRGKTAVLEEGMEYNAIPISNADAQFLETKRFSVEDICRLFGVPPHRVGHLEQSTNNNIEHQGLEYVIYTMTPWAVRWESAIIANLLPDDSDLQIKFDFRQLLRGDSKARSIFYHNGILDGWLTRNEAREYEDLDPLDGLDEPLRPLNMMPENEAEEETDETEQAELEKNPQLPPKKTTQKGKK